MGTFPLKMASQKLCLGCSFGWGLLAVILVCVALGTDFWYVLDKDGLNTYAAAAYGVVNVCGYSSDKDLTINTQDSGWSCTKWDDISGDSDCRKAAANGLAWGIMGLLATAPAAVICLLTCFCAEKCMGNCIGKVISFLTLGCLLFATVAFMIAPAVLAGECDEFNKKQSADGYTLDMSYSFYCCMTAIFSACISLLCYLIYFCSKPNEDEEFAEGTAQQPERLQEYGSEFHEGQQA